MKPDPQRIEDLKRLKIPSGFVELKPFIGHITFYCKFAENLSTLIHPLHELVNSSEWRWTARHQEAYDEVLEEIGSSVLVPYPLKRPLRLTCDASLVRVGVVIYHIMEDKTARPIAFASKTRSDAETNHPQHEKGALTLMFGIKKFFKYLLGREFEIVSDNRAIVAIFGPSTKQKPATAARLLRWRLLLGAYRYKIVYARGDNIPQADHLSRLPEPDDTPVESSVNFVDHLETKIVSAADVAAETAKDPVFIEAHFYTQHGWPQEPPAILKTYHDKMYEHSSLDGCLLRGNRVAVPSALQTTVVQRLHEIHPGVSKMKRLARSYVWWPVIDRQIESAVAECLVCQTLHRNIPHNPFVPWTWAPPRWQRIFVDFAYFQNTELLVLVDHHSKWPEVKIVQSLKAIDVCEALRGFYASYGLPEQLVSDNGPPSRAPRLRSS